MWNYIGIVFPYTRLTTNEPMQAARSKADVAAFWPEIMRSCALCPQRRDLNIEPRPNPQKFHLHPLP